MVSTFSYSWKIFKIWIRSFNYQVRPLLITAIRFSGTADTILTFLYVAVVADYIMVGRASILLRGLAHMLQQSRSVAKSWKPLAERVLQEDL